MKSMQQAISFWHLSWVIIITVLAAVIGAYQGRFILKKVWLLQSFMTRAIQSINLSKILFVLISAMATMYVSLVTIILIFLYLLSMNSNIGTLINEISPFFGGIIYWLIYFLIFFILQTPALAITVHLFKRSLASKFLNVLEQIKLPQIILIPIAVIFRFIPGYKMEHQIIVERFIGTLLVISPTFQDVFLFFYPQVNKIQCAFPMN